MPAKDHTLDDKADDNVTLDELSSRFVSLRIGESVTDFQIKTIRRLPGKKRTDNLPGVDFRYVLESTDGKLLTVNSWVLWNEIRKALRSISSLQGILDIAHVSHSDYTVSARRPGQTRT